MSDLYNNIRNRRLALGLSQDELAKRMGYISRSSIAKIESGDNDIPQSKIEAFAKALDTTPSYLMGWNEEKPADNSELSEIKKDFIAFIDTLDDQQVERVRELVLTALRLGEK